MTTKKLYVSSSVQKALLAEVLIPEMATGFWKDHRPTDHAKQWEDVDIVVTDTEKLGPVDFEIPRLYNFVNPNFIKPNEARLVEVAQAAKASSNFRSVKKELIELSRIVGGRLTDKNGIPSKANRGTNKPGGSVAETVKKAKETVKKAGTTAKKTAVKKGTTTTKKGNTTVKRTPVVKGNPAAATQGGTDANAGLVQATEGGTTETFDLNKLAEQIVPTGEAVIEAETVENQAAPIEGTQVTEGVSDAEIAEAAKLVQDGEVKVIEQVTTVTTTTTIEKEPAHEVAPTDTSEKQVG